MSCSTPGQQRITLGFESADRRGFGPDVDWEIRARAISVVLSARGAY